MTSVLAVIGFSYFYGIFLAMLAGEGAVLYIAVAFCVLFAVSLFFIQKIKLVTLALGAVTVSLFVFWGACLNASEIYVLEDSTYQVSGTVEEAGARGALFTYVLSACELEDDGKAVYEKPFKMELRSWQPMSVSAGERLQVRATFYQPAGGYLDEKGSLAAKGIHITGYADDKSGCSVTEPDKKTFAYYRHKVLEFFSETLESLMPLDTAHLTEAMLLGDRQAVQGNANNQYRTAGVSHLLVVSGMHLAIVASVLTKLLSKRRIPPWLKAAVLLLTVLLFAAVTGFGISVLRAGIMVAVTILASAFGRTGDSLSSLGLAVLLICGVNPFAAGDVGFILSVFATLGIILFSEKLQAGFERFIPLKNPVLSFVFGNIAVSAAAMVFIVPIAMYLFGNYSVFSVISTAVLTFPSTIIIEFGLLICVFGWFMGPVLMPAAIICGLMCRFSLWYTGVIPEWSNLYAGEYSFFAAAGIALIMLIIFFSGRKGVRITGIVCCAAVLISSFAANMLWSGDVKIRCAEISGGYEVSIAYKGESVKISTKASEKAYGFDEAIDLNFGGLKVQSDVKNEIIEIEANGKVILLEKGGRPHEYRAADILVAAAPCGRLSPVLTVLAPAESMEDAVRTLPAGNYVRCEVLMTVSKDGELTLKPL